MKELPVEEGEANTPKGAAGYYLFHCTTYSTYHMLPSMGGNILPIALSEPFSNSLLFVPLHRSQSIRQKHAIFSSRWMLLKEINRGGRGPSSPASALSPQAKADYGSFSRECRTKSCA